jgi:hypothetical protein
MTERFVLDACALIAFFYKEEGGVKVKQTLERAQQNNAEVYMNELYVLEVYFQYSLTGPRFLVISLTRELVHRLLTCLRNYIDTIFRRHVLRHSP